MEHHIFCLCMRVCGFSMMSVIGKWIWDIWFWKYNDKIPSRKYLKYNTVNKSVTKTATKAKIILKVSSGMILSVKVDTVSYRL